MGAISSMSVDKSNPQ